MKVIFRPMATLSLVSLLFTASAQAALYDRGGGLIYDDYLDVTWMQDASYVSNQAVNWTTAHDMVSGLEYQDTARNTVWTDWRMPTIDPGTYSGWGFDLQSGESNYNAYDTSPSGANELAYMYYVNLGFEGNGDLLTAPELLPLPESPEGSYNPFQNINYLGIWTDSHVGGDAPESQVWYFHFHFGRTLTDGGSDTQTIWAVRDGDVGLPSPVPVPPAFWLMGSSLALLGFVSSKKGNASAKA